MKKNFLLLFCASLLAISTTFAQSSRNCGTMHHHEQLLQQHPELIEQYVNAEKSAQQWANTHQSGQRAVITIPVVVHVIYANSTQNISDAQIASQIAVLNEDYSRTNSDASNTPSAFAGVAANCEIQFCLATKDPSGNATTGIIRKSTTTTSFSDDDAVKSSSTGGDNPWDRNNYLNIWVCNLGGGLLGYAQFPGGPASTDGVVIGYKYFGRVGTLQSPYNLGRTATHEVGHWLGLYHIWGNSTSGCSDSDNIADTPNQSQSNGGCPSFPLTDACSPSYPGIMFMNYMDYVDDNCMNMFTLGQKTKMQSILGSTRLSLQSSTGCSGSTNCAGLAAPVIQGFESTAFPPTSPGTWQLNNPDNGITWARTTSVAYNSIASVYMNNYDYSSGVGQADDIFTPVIKAPTSNPRITFDCAYTYYQDNNGSSYDTLLIGVSNDCGSTFNLVASAYGANLMTTTGPSSSAFVPTSSDWKSYYVSISQYAGQDVMVIFRSKSGYGNNMYLDNIGIKQGVVGIDEKSLDDKYAHFTVFPNPSNGEMNITYLADKNKNTKITLYDLTGRSVMEQDFRANQGENTFQFNGGNLPKGYYILRLNDGEKVGVSKIVIE